MIIYRPHKGSLQESLEQAKEFETVEEMKMYIVEDWSEYYRSIGFKNQPFGIDDIVVDEETCDDDRCGWHDCRYVCVKRMGNEVYKTPQCIGMCATDYDKRTIE